MLKTPKIATPGRFTRPRIWEFISKLLAIRPHTPPSPPIAAPSECAATYSRECCTQEHRSRRLNCSTDAAAPTMKRHFLSIPTLLFCGALVAVGPLTSNLLAQSPPARIDIVVVEGQGVVNHARHPVAHNLVVRVEDDDQRPVSGASVVFALPVNGPSGSFVNGATNLTVTTDVTGVAVAHGLRTNQNPGKLDIYVTASYRGVRAKALITQQIEGEAGAPPRPAVTRSHSGGKWKWVVLGVVAVGAAGGGIYYYNSQHTASSSAISITTGSVLFGSPH